VGAELNRTREWFWHLNSKEECANAVRVHGAALGITKCCYAWVRTRRLQPLANNHLACCYPRHRYPIWVNPGTQNWEWATLC
jgi:hypothetical protein